MLCITNAVPGDLYAKSTALDNKRTLLRTQAIEPGRLLGEKRTRRKFKRVGPSPESKDFRGKNITIIINSMKC